MIPPYIQKFALNTSGTDYVVGDIHGRFSDLSKLLTKIEFNPEVDRLFSVGDLCDRGPESSLVFDWLNFSWFFPVRGNHEQALIWHQLGFLDDDYLESVMSAKWWLSVSPDNKKNHIEKLKSLPVLIEVSTKKGPVGIVHAQCPHKDWQKVAQVAKTLDEFEFLQTCQEDGSAVHYSIEYLNVYQIIVGHMRHRLPTLRGNVLYLDTGSGFPGGKLSIVNLRTFECVTE